MKQHIAEAELRITKEIIEVKGRVERLEEQRSNPPAIVPHRPHLPLTVLM
jgi:hypothetical protein